MSGRVAVLEEGLGGFLGAARELAVAVRGICSGARVYGRYSAGVLDLWTVLPARDDQTEESLAEAEWALMRSHPNILFDFLLLEEDSRSLATAMDAGYVLVEAA